MRTAILAGILVALGSVAGLLYLKDARDAGQIAQENEVHQAQAKELAEPAYQRELARETESLILPSMPPLPEGLPLVGAEGTDRWGMPYAEPDDIALRQLLLAQRFDDLEAHFGAYQAAFEKEANHERWPLRACAAFRSSQPELVAALEAWRAAKPDSYAATCAWAQHLEREAWDLRGGGFASDVTPEAMKAFEAKLLESEAAYRRALELQPQALAPAVELIVSARDLGLDEAEQKARIDAALKICKTCASPHAAHLEGLRTRWGGSEDAQKAYVKRITRGKASKAVRALAGFPHDDRCRDLRTAEDYEGAVAACRKAAELGDYEDDLIDVLARAGEMAEALERSNARLETHPRSMQALKVRYDVSVDQKNVDAQAPVVLAMRRIAPSDETWAKRAAWTTDALAEMARHDVQRGERDTAKRRVDICLEINPNDQHCWTVRGMLIAANPNGIQRARELVEANPDDFNAHRMLDYALSTERDFRAIIEAWDGFIARHPDHAQALFERAAARKQLGDREGTMADVKKACSLGHREACQRQQQLGG